MKAPLLFLGWGNPSRGDDAIGPLLCERLAQLCAGDPQCEVQLDFQLQIEDAFDIAGRELVVFIDASVSAAAPFEFRPVCARADTGVTTHAMRPEAVLATARDVLGCEPAAFVLAVRGERFELGAQPSPAAASNLEAAWQALQKIAQASEPLRECQAWAQR